MRSRRLLVVAFLATFPLALFAKQEAETAARTQVLVKQLGNTDASVRGAAKLELMGSPSPEALPVLLNALETSADGVRSILLEVLTSYKDPREIPTLLKIARPYSSNLNDKIQFELRRFGAVAA